MPFWRSVDVQQKQVLKPFWRTVQLTPSDNIPSPLIPESRQPFWRSGEQSSATSTSQMLGKDGSLFWRSTDISMATPLAPFWRSGAASVPSETSTSNYQVFWRSRISEGHASPMIGSPLLSSANSTIVDDDTNVQEYDPMHPFQTTTLNKVPNLTSILGEKSHSLLSTSQVVEAIAYSVSSHLYVYETGTGVGNAILHWHKKGELNFNGQKPLAYKMQIRPGAASAILGALDTTSDKGIFSAFTTAAGLLSMLPQLYRFSARPKSTRTIPFVIHVSAYDVDDNLNNVANYANIVLAREAGAVILASQSIHEAGQMAIAAYTIAQKTGKAVVHVFAGSDAGATLFNGINLSWATPRTWENINTQLNSVLQNRRSDIAIVIENLLARVGGITSTPLSPVKYEGHPLAKKILVIFGADEVNEAFIAAKQAAKHGDKVGVLGVSVFCPLHEDIITGSIPHTVTDVVVFEQVDDINESNAVLYSRMINAFAVAGNDFKKRPFVENFKYNARQNIQRAEFTSFLSQLEQGKTLKFEETGVFMDDKAKVCVFIGEDSEANISASYHIASIFAKENNNLSTTLSETFDNYFENGVYQARLALSAEEIPDIDVNRTADFAAVDANLLDKLDIVSFVRQKGTLLLVADNAVESLIEKIPPNTKKALAANQITIFAIDANNILKTLKLADDAISVIIQAAFLHLYTNRQRSLNIDELISQNYVPEATKKVSEIITLTLENLNNIQIDSTWIDLQVEDIKLPKTIEANGLSPNLHKSFEELTTIGYIPSWSSIVQRTIFSEAYNTEKQLRPDMPEQNFVVTVTENKRLTPTTYDRNVFHMELDITGTNLKYDIGEALGVHGWNDVDDVMEFIKWYKLNPDELVTVPSVIDPNILETRTIFQALQQNLDIFGKPPKKFFEQLAKFAKDKKEMRKIAFVGSGDGKIIYKKRTDEDTQTYVDILKEFPSAHPSFVDLVRLVQPIKPRHYSIASSQNMHPNQIHLLVVTVDWQDNRGRQRYGQCTRYLSNLSIGSKITVSIKPSVMKLPPLSTQPIIMAGLGTGMAPFRAFLQEREYQRLQGKEVGPIALYFGSRYRSQEYLYGEEIEAYHIDGLLTHLGLAFSRDGPNKVYIQHKMNNDKELLRKWMLEQGGYFYLCGPTWPVPDVAMAMTDAFKAGGVEDPASFIENLKNDSRYVLEVY